LIGDDAHLPADGTLLGIGLGLFLLPLLSALILIFFGRKLPKGGDWVAQTAIVGCAVGAVWLFWQVIVQHGSPDWSWWSHNAHSADGNLLEWDWVTLGAQKLTVGIFFDNLSVIMVSMVTVVASCIFFFSAGYMHGDRDYPRFFAYLSYFCFAMMGLVVVDNLLFLFIFWELVGVGSYLLIGFFYDQEEPPKASLKAFMVNRIGDVLFLLGLIMAWQLFGTLRYPELFERLAAGEFAALAPDHVLAGWDHYDLLTLSGILIFCGAMSKSAQLPLHTWLPDAMAGPTPVSALIHAATMVAAGVFMVGRMYPYFTPTTLGVIASVGACTALVGATLGLVMWDIKKVLAYSTMSQLGYMMMGLGVGGYIAGLFHLITHAFFKACLFLGSGSVIHAVHSQDMRDMGGLKKKMPWTYTTFLVATLALAGVPMFAGYYSKDQIIVNALAWGMSRGVAFYIPFVFGAVGAFMTTFYMFRLVFLTFHGAPQDKEKYAHAHESPFNMVMPLVVLATVALLGGGTMNPLADTDGLWFNSVVHQPESAASIGLGLTVADASRHADPAAHEGAAGHGEAAAGADASHGGDEGIAAAGGHEGLSEWEHYLHQSHYPALIVSLLMIVTGFLLARRMYLTRVTDAGQVSKAFGPLHGIISKKYYFDEIYAVGVVGSLLKVSHAFAWFDKNILDGVVNLVGLLTRFCAFLSGLFDTYVIDGLVNFWRGLIRGMSSVFRLIQTGNARDYLTWTLVGVLILAAVLA
jgi:NADH-quinone oxidoreductase subunit L